MKKFFAFMVFVSLSVVFAQELSLDSDVVSGTGNAPSYVEFSGTYAADQIASADQIREIGKSLGRTIRKNENDPSPFAVGNPEYKYSAARAYGKDKPGADILYLGKTAGVDTIKCLRMIISGYVEEAFGTSRIESDVIAASLCDWNANNFNNKAYFEKLYAPEVFSLFSDRCTDIGLPSDFNDWPNSRIVIPHKDAGTADVTALSAASVMLESEIDSALESPEEAEEDISNEDKTGAFDFGTADPSILRSTDLEEQNAAKKKWPWWLWLLLILLILILLLILIFMLIRISRKRNEENDGEEKTESYDGSAREAELLERLKEENPDADIKLDGSYPMYYRQKIKILMIGKDNNGIDGTEYNEAMIRAYKAHAISSKNGFMTPSAHIVHRRVLKYVYGLERDLDYKDIPKANDLADLVGESNESGGFSFARINVFKNAEEDSSYNDDLKLIQEQIRILSPDIAIGMKLDDEALKKLGTLEEIDSEGSSKMYRARDDKGYSYGLINAGIYFSDPKGGDEILYEELRTLFKKI